jgi:triacylglycerol lipase
MPAIYRKVKELFVDGWSWMLDYMYVGFWQVHGFILRSNPQVYTKNDHSKEVPIVLIPGIYENWQFMKPVADMLHQAGHTIYVIDELGYNTGDIETMASIANDFIMKHELKKYIIVAHSKGGLVGKYILAQFNAQHTALGMISLNTPYSGSPYARFIPLKSTRIFVPDSPILSQLALNSDINKSIVSIYGLFDPHVPKGSYLEKARNIQLETRGHFRIMNKTEVHAAILQGLDFLLKP